MKARSVVKRGAEVGIELSPHKHRDGCYVASRTRFAVDYVRVKSVNELKILADAGFSIRMSNQDSQQHRSPSLIAPSSIDWDE